MKVLVVGLNPSRKHGNSPSIKTLYKWLDRLSLKRVSFINLYEDYKIDYKTKKIDYIKCISKEYDHIIALGNIASRNLHDVGINHFRLPHPSGLNRQLNDLKFVDDQLTLCKNYLHGGL